MKLNIYSVYTGCNRMGKCLSNCPRMHAKSGHYGPVSETPSEWRFAGGPIVARNWILAGFTL